jgi:hypothetical protein
MWSVPLRYFEFSTPSRIVGILNEQGQGYPLDGDVVIGGGGLLGNPTFAKSLYHICRNRKGKLISWGIGHNIRRPGKKAVIRHYGWRKRARLVRGHLMSWGVLPRPLPPKIRYDEQQDLLDLFDLHGLRDYDCGYPWVPCVSCMHPLIDTYRARSAEHDIVVCHHPDFMELHIEGLPLPSFPDTAILFLCVGTWSIWIGV